MSGGVDSSVSAALMKEQGYDVMGVFFKVWQPPFMECDWQIEREDAMRVAAKLGIDFKTLDLSKEYKEHVVDYMLSEYEGGRTPNPDVMCNSKIKFGTFFEWAIQKGADFIATGHYVKTEEGRLLMSADTKKDQTYFLWGLSKEVLERTMFPIGNLEKSKVREIAAKLDLSVADKKDSQGVCLLGKLDMREFLKHFLEEKRGSVLNSEGEIIGHHEGSIFHTLGQRHGFIVTEKTPNDDPYYVVSKNIVKNTITVSHNKGEKAYTTKKVTLTQTNWISESPKIGGKYLARFRYRQPLKKCTIQGKTVLFNESQSAVASGQSLVLYEGEVCIGGGVIE